MDDPVANAREMLDRLEAGVAARDASALDALFTDDVTLFGTAAANFGADESRGYLRQVIESSSTIRWHLDRWSVVHHDDAQLLVAAAGQVASDEGDGPEQSDFRLTMWLVRQQDAWKIGHFHGSVPEA